MPESAAVATSATGATLWKAVDSRRAVWTGRIRSRAQAILATDWRDRIVPAVAHAHSAAHAFLLIEQALHPEAAAWEEFVYRLYAEIGQDFAARTALQLKSGAVSETKADVRDVLRQAGLDDRWMPVVADWLGKQAGIRVRSIQSTLLADIRRVLDEGARAGLGMTAIAKRLASLGPAITRGRAAVIARTEVIAASNLGARAGALSTELPLDHEWISTPGGRTRPWHAHANGQTHPMSEPFEVGGQRLMFPGDGSLGASSRNLVNCRCATGYKRALPATS